MEIKTHNRIEFKIVEDQTTYSFFIPHGCKLDKAIEMASAFLGGLVKLQKETQDSQEDEEKVDDNVESN